jgi:hypothetical protein
MKAFTDLLYFEPKISMSDWPLVIEALKDVYPNIRWASGRELGPYLFVNKDKPIFVCNTLTITSIKNKPLLTQGMWANKEDFARHALGVNSNYAEIKDGWEHLGFKQDMGSIFDSLAESKLIRKILKESMDEFDWVDTNIYNSGQGLFNLMQEFLKTETNGKYYLEQDMNIIELSDNTGIYYSYNSMQDFTIDNIVRDFERTLNYYDRHSRIGQEYQELAKILEPIIGPINID